MTWLDTRVITHLSISNKSMNDSTCEPQYNCVLDLKNERGFERMGLMSNYVWHDDPKRLVFLLSRYKFVAKMMSGKSKVLEVGCADGFGTRIVRQEVGSVTAVDFDPLFIDDAKQNCSDKWPIEFHVHDMLEGGFSERSFDGAYAVDVLDPAELRAAVVEIAKKLEGELS